MYDIHVIFLALGAIYVINMFLVFATKLDFFFLVTHCVFVFIKILIFSYDGDLFSAVMFTPILLLWLGLARLVYMANIAKSMIMKADRGIE